MIITGNIFNNQVSEWEEYRLKTVVKMMVSNGIKTQAYDEKSPPMQAYINHGRWLVKCECGGAEKVWEEGWIMCCSCFNEKHGNKYRKTKFPKNRRQIEELLILRPMRNRNWMLGESIKQLKLENTMHREELYDLDRRC